MHSWQILTLIVGHKYQITTDGLLLIFNVSESDADKHYTCRTANSHVMVSKSKLMNVTLRVRSKAEKTMHVLVS